MDEKHHNPHLHPRATIIPSLQPESSFAETNLQIHNI